MGACFFDLDVLASALIKLHTASGRLLAYEAMGRAVGFSEQVVGFLGRRLGLELGS